MSEYYSANQAAELMGVPAPTIYRWCQKAKLYGAVKKSKGGWKIPRSTVLNYLKNNGGSKTVQKYVNKAQQKEQEQQKPIDLEQASKQLEANKAELDSTIHKPQKNNGDCKEPSRDMRKFEAEEWLVKEKALKLYRENRVAEGNLIEKAKILPQLKDVLSVFANDLREFVLKTCMDNKLDAVATDKAKRELDETFRKCFKKLEGAVKK